MLNTYRILITLLLSVLLTGCGFHLRGHEPLPDQLKVLYVQSNSPYSDFMKQFKSFLTSANVTLVDKPQQAPITIQILNEGTSQLLTGTSASGQTNTYALNYTVVYQLLSRNGEVIEAPQTVTTSRSYSITSNQVLGDTNVQGNLINQMERDVIYQVMSRLRAPVTLKILNAHLAKTP